MQGTQLLRWSGPGLRPDGEVKVWVRPGAPGFQELCVDPAASWEGPGPAGILVLPLGARPVERPGLGEAFASVARAFPVEVLLPVGAGRDAKVGDPGRGHLRVEVIEDTGRWAELVPGEVRPEQRLVWALWPEGLGLLDRLRGALTGPRVPPLALELPVPGPGRWSMPRPFIDRPQLCYVEADGPPTWAADARGLAIPAWESWRPGARPGLYAAALRSPGPSADPVILTP